MEVIIVNKILVIGSMNMDLVVNTDEIPSIGETVLGNSMIQVPGGKGANQAVAMSKLEADVTFLGKVGSDAYGSSLLESMSMSGVNIDHIERNNNNTGIAVINVDKNADNNIIVIAGANWNVDKKYLEKHRNLFQENDLVVFQLEIPLTTVKEGLKISKEYGKTTILNPAPAFDLDDETISYIDILIPNEHELERLSKIKIIDEDSIISAAKVLINKGVNIIIITLGSEGVLYIDQQQTVHYPAFEVNVVDTTAAGDSFIAGFATEYLKTNNIKKSVERGQSTASLTIQKMGAQSSLPTKADVDSFMSDN